MSAPAFAKPVPNQTCRVYRPAMAEGGYQAVRIHHREGRREVAALIIRRASRFLGLGCALALAHRLLRRRLTPLVNR